jgi:ABC-type phosphate/phosphonate transport system substrate-binding protein
MTMPKNSPNWLSLQVRRSTSAFGGEPMKPLLRTSIVRALALFALLFPLSIAARGAGEGPSDTSAIRFAITSGVLESDVNPDDALVAAKVWAATLGAGSGFWTKSDARIFYNSASIIEPVKRGELDVIALSTQEYLEIELGLQADPILTYVQAGQVELEYVILARLDSGIRTLADLSSRKLVTAKGGRNSMALLWLDALLFDNSLPPKEALFKEVREVPKTSQVVLPVFFKQMDVGIVTKSAFETSVALNPQLGQQLKIIATSPRVVPMVTCFRCSLPVDRRAAYINTALKLHESPGGLQTFNVFKLERLVRWEPRYATSVRELMRKQKLARSVRPGQTRASLTLKEEK